MPSTTKTNHPDLIAPCGIDCRLCRAYGRDRRACPGCRSDEARFKPKACVVCRIRNCPRLAAGEFRFCYECVDFPCQTLTRLEKSYTTRYKTSPLENLRSIREIGIERFIEAQDAKWSCPVCGSLLCMHKPDCPACGSARDF